MKSCSKCKLAKNLSEFYVKDKSGRLHAQCKACYKEHRKTFYREHYLKYGEGYRLRTRIRRALVTKRLRIKMLDYMDGKKCVHCGESDIRTFEFDHIDPSKKSFGISKAVAEGLKWESILREISKCRILCANCHKKRTAEAQGWYKHIAMNR